MPREIGGQTPPRKVSGDALVKTLRFNSLLASTALALVLVLGSHPGMAQQSDQQISAGVPMPDTSLPTPLTEKDVQAAPEAAKAEPKRDIPPVVNAATAPAPAPAAMPASTVAENAVTDQLRETINGKLDRIVTRKADREGVEAFYKARDYKPLWVANGAAGERAQKAIAYLGQVETVGLDPNDYPTPDFKNTTPEGLAQDELKLTASVLAYARHAQIGRIHFSRVSGDIQFNLETPEPAKVLEKIADAKDAGQALDSFNPPQAEFKALKEKLAEIRKGGGVIAKPEEKEKPGHVNVHVPEGKILRPGMKDQRVIALRKRLDIKGDKENTLYDDAVRDAVKTFQTEADLDNDGNLGPNTVRAMNGEREKKVARSPSAANPVDTIIVNMERWRWLPRDLGNPHVIVNVPDYTLTLYNNDKVYWHTRIVVGKPGSHATPMVSAEMKFITVNPTWNVPPSIIENEYLPALQQDPQALERIGLKVSQDADGTVHISQPPGAGNALGRIRFNFPNKFLVYQHDTPDKYLFARDERAYSHGCMRVQNPLTYGEKLLSLVMPNERYTEAKLQSMFGGSEVNINFPKFIWVHLTYQTAFVENDGKLQLRKDVYGRDAKMIAILKGSERKVADIGIERAPNTSSKPVKMPVGTYGGNSYRNGGSFFDFLFGGSPAAQPVYRPPSRVGNNSRSQFR
jgi:L,D-transpeptidase YcbB